MADPIAETLAAFLKRPNILAMDESPPTFKKRADKYGFDVCSGDLIWRWLVATCPALSEHIGAVIMHTDTFDRQVPFTDVPYYRWFVERGVIANLKGDGGLVEFPEGSDVYPGEKTAGPKFAGVQAEIRQKLEAAIAAGSERLMTKFRVVTRVNGDTGPSQVVLDDNANQLASAVEYYLGCGALPVYEPEIVRDGDHTIKRSFEVTSRQLSVVYEEFSRRGIDLSKAVIKVNVVTPGTAAADGKTFDPERVAHDTLECWSATIPKEVPVVVALSGGIEASMMFRVQNEIAKAAGAMPWKIGTSYGRASQHYGWVVFASNGGEPPKVESVHSIITRTLETIAAAQKGELVENQLLELEKRTEELAAHRQ